MYFPQLIKIFPIVIRIKSLHPIEITLSGIIALITSISIAALHTMDGSMSKEYIILLMKMEECIVVMLLLMDIKLIKAGHE